MGGPSSICGSEHHASPRNETGRIWLTFNKAILLCQDAFLVTVALILAWRSQFGQAHPPRPLRGRTCIQSTLHRHATKRENAFEHHVLCITTQLRSRLNVRLVGEIARLSSAMNVGCRGFVCALEARFVFCKS